MSLKDKLTSQKRWFAAAGAAMPIIAQALTGEVGWLEAVVTSALTVLVSMGIILKEDLEKIRSAVPKEDKK